MPSAGRMMACVGSWRRRGPCGGPPPPSCQRRLIRLSIPAGHCDWYPKWAQGAGSEIPGESQALGEEFRAGPSGAPHLEEAHRGITGGNRTKRSPLRLLTSLDLLTPPSTSPGTMLGMRLMSCRSKSSPAQLYGWRWARTSE